MARKVVSEQEYTAVFHQQGHTKTGGKEGMKGKRENEEMQRRGQMAQMTDT